MLYLYLRLFETLKLKMFLFRFRIETQFKINRHNNHIVLGILKIILGYLI